MKFKKNILPGAMVFLTMASSCITDSEPSGGNIAVGDSLPDFSVTLDNGRTVSTSSLRGKTAVIIFFNTSCPDCRREFPVIQEVWQQIENDPNITLFAIAREEEASSIASYWENYGLTFPWSPQSGREIYSLFAAAGIPRIYIANPQGTVTTIFTDTDMPSATTLLKIIKPDI